MKVSELIEVLADRLAVHGDRKVLVTWEGIFRDLDSSHVFLGKIGALLLDADENTYKEKMAVDPHEGMNLVAPDRTGIAG